ncbi:MAG: Gfo/Idh/MocA family protein [Planctomycetota bacterium]|jgi:predicted dehydrogenase
MMVKRQSTRRTFLRASAALAAGASAFAIPGVARGRVNASDRIRVAVVGVRGRGRSHIRSLQKLAGEGVEIAALCDVYESVLHARAAECEKAPAKKPAVFVDYRDLLDDDSIDAVALATPDHWHALQTIWACQAGKDVYCEKVGAHNLTESRMMVDAARKYKRIVQHGTQARSSANVREGIRKLHEGVVGEVYMARAIAFKYRAGGKNDFRPVPEGLNWDLWQGPAQKRPFNGLAFSPRWRFIKEYGNGQIGAQGVHQLDMIRWGLKLEKHPTTIQALGGRYSRPSSHETLATEMNVTYKFENPNFLVTFETRAGYANPEAGMGTKYPWVNHRDLVGAIFFGSEGYMIIPDFSNYYTFLGRKHERGPGTPDVKPSLMDDGHVENWVAALRSQNPKDLTADVAEGHLSSSLCYLGNIACETERTLKFDPDSERFIDDDRANRLLTRDYREPFTLPKVL